MRSAVDRSREQKNREIAATTANKFIDAVWDTESDWLKLKRAELRDHIFTALQSVTEDAFSDGVGSVITIRCSKHYSVPQQNKTEHSGGECGGCIAAERDEFRIALERIGFGPGDPTEIARKALRTL